MRQRLPMSLLLLAAATSAAAQPARATWQLVETVRYGGDRPEATITNAGPLAVTSDGAVYAVQVADGTVLVFDGSGAYRKTIGRRGQGPGEFTRPLQAGTLGDTVWVSDQELRRVSFFYRRTFLRTERVTVNAKAPFFTSTPTAFLRDGSAVTLPAVNAQLIARGVVNRLPLLRHRRDGTVTDTLRWMSLTNQSGSGTAGTNGFFAYRQPFADGPTLAAAIDGSGLVVVDRTAATDANTAQFTVTRFGPQGTLLYTKPVAYVPTPLSRQRASEALAAIVPPSRGGAPPIRLDEVEKSFYRPRFLPPVTEVVVATDGAVWLRGEDTSAATVLYRVLDATGALMATLTVPRSLTIRHATATQVYAFGTVDDEPYLARFRIAKIGR